MTWIIDPIIVETFHHNGGYPQPGEENTLSASEREIRWWEFDLAHTQYASPLTLPQDPPMLSEIIANDCHL